MQIANHGAILNRSYSLHKTVLTPTVDESGHIQRSHWMISRNAPWRWSKAGVLLRSRRIRPDIQNHCGQLLGPLLTTHVLLRTSALHLRCFGCRVGQESPVFGTHGDRGRVTYRRFRPNRALIPRAQLAACASALDPDELLRKRTGTDRIPGLIRDHESLRRREFRKNTQRFSRKVAC